MVRLIPLASVLLLWAGCSFDFDRPAADTGADSDAPRISYLDSPAECPAGTQLVGGGAECEPGEHLRVSYPELPSDAGTTAWTAACAGTPR